MAAEVKAAEEDVRLTVTDTTVATRNPTLVTIGRKEGVHMLMPLPMTKLRTYSLVWMGTRYVDHHLGTNLVPEL